MDGYDTAMLVKVILAWVGVGAGTIMALMCLGGALNGWAEGRACPVGKGKSEWWMCMGFFAAGLAVAGACVYYIFFSERPSIERERPGPRILQSER